MRPIDDGNRARVNEATNLWEPITCGSGEFVPLLAKAFIVLIARMLG